jgi:hypothetical protein
MIFILNQNENLTLCLRGFHAKTTTQAIEGIETLSLEYKPHIEENKPVSIL